jgi:hypothetical protein
MVGASINSGTLHTMGRGAESQSVRAPGNPPSLAGKAKPPDCRRAAGGDQDAERTSLPLRENCLYYEGLPPHPFTALLSAPSITPHPIRTGWAVHWTVAVWLLVSYVQAKVKEPSTGTLTVTFPDAGGGSGMLAPCELAVFTQQLMTVGVMPVKDCFEQAAMILLLAVKLRTITSGTANLYTRNVALSSDSFLRLIRGK